LSPPTPGEELSLAEVTKLADRDELVSVTVLAFDSRIIGTSEEGDFWVSLIDARQAGEVANSLTKDGTPLRIDSQRSKVLLDTATSWALPIATMIVGFAFLFVIFRGPRGDFSALGRSHARRFRARDGGQVRFADVAGLDEAVEELREVKDFLTSPASFEALGATPPRGILLLGPPGCGKTLLAKAVAGEADVPFFSIAATEFVEMLVGVGAARIRDLFQRARAAAPSIVFIDELDAIGRERTSHGLNQEQEASLNELLVQLDGFDPRSRVVLMAATNRADILDSALVRKGRFDRQVVVDLPDLNARFAIFKVHARGKALGTDIDLHGLARRTVGFSGADIASVMNEAALLAARRRLAQVGSREMNEAIERVIGGLERRSRVLGDEEKWRVAYHEGAHALVGWVLNLTSTIDKVSIVARGSSLGSTWHLPTDDRHLKTRSQIEQEITYLLAGRACEDIVYSDPSDGARNDLERATRLASEMICDLGMSDSLGPRVITRDDSNRLTGQEWVGQSIADEADREIGRVLTEADARCRTVITACRQQLDRLAGLLVERETLERTELQQVLGDLSKGLPTIPMEQRRSGRAQNATGSASSSSN